MPCFLNGENIMRIIATILASLTLVACSQAPESETVEPTAAPVAQAATEAVDTVAACTKRGIAYFKEIGSYPTLSSAPNRGRSADEVAAERCNRTLTAF